MKNRIYFVLLIVFVLLVLERIKKMDATRIETSKKIRLKKTQNGMKIIKRKYW